MVAGLGTNRGSRGHATGRISLGHKIVQAVFGIGLAVVAFPSVSVAQDAHSELQRTSSASADEMLQYVKDAQDEIAAAAKQLGKLTGNSDKSELSDDSKQCVQNSFTVTDALQQVTVTAAQTMADALTAGQRERAEHEFRKVAIALKKARVMLSEGQQCAGGDASADGATDIRVDGALTADADEDVSAVSEDTMDYGFDPPNASPF